MVRRSQPRRLAAGQRPPGDGTALNVRARRNAARISGCRPNPCIEDYWFHCPCHQSRYDRLGSRPPASATGRRRAAWIDTRVEVDADGVLTIDTRQVTRAAAHRARPARGDRATGCERLHMTVILRLYPGPWRARYGDEMEALLTVAPGSRERVDLMRGALDAWLHPAAPSRVPAIAALIGGGLWTIAARVPSATPPSRTGRGTSPSRPVATWRRSSSCRRDGGLRAPRRRPGRGGGSRSRSPWSGTSPGSRPWSSRRPADRRRPLAAAQALAMLGAALVGAVLVRVGDERSGS